MTSYHFVSFSYSVAPLIENVKEYTKHTSKFIWMTQALYE